VNELARTLAGDFSAFLKWVPWLLLFVELFFSLEALAASRFPFLDRLFDLLALCSAAFAFFHHLQVLLLSF